MINERQEARKVKNFARADEIRNMLSDKGIILEDTREGVKWKELRSVFTAILGVEDSNPAEYSGLALAYIGDSVFDLLVKTVLVSKDNKQAFKYHKEAIHIVNAESQAGYIDLLEEKLTEQEMAIYKRGRNTKTHSKAKNASVGQYRKATGFEALIGYLYLNKEYDRLFELTRDCWNQNN